MKEYKSQFCKDKCSYCGSCHYYNLRQKMMSTHGIIVCNQDLLAVNMHKKANYRRQLMSEDIGIVVVDDERVIIRTKLEKPSKIKGLALI